MEEPPFNATEKKLVYRSLGEEKTTGAHHAYPLSQAQFLPAQLRTINIKEGCMCK